MLKLDNRHALNIGSKLGDFLTQHSNIVEQLGIRRGHQLRLNAVLPERRLLAFDQICGFAEQSADLGSHRNTIAPEKIIGFSFIFSCLHEFGWMEFLLFASLREDG